MQRNRDRATGDLFDGALLPERPHPSGMLAKPWGCWFRLCPRVNQYDYNVLLANASANGGYQVPA